MIYDSFKNDLAHTYDVMISKWLNCLKMTIADYRLLKAGHCADSLKANTVTSLVIALWK